MCSLGSAGKDGPWSEFDLFIAEWSRPGTAQDGLSETDLISAEERLGHRLPTVLREWYKHIGRRTDLTSTQNHLCTPAELQVVDDFLVIYLENQAVAAWGIPLAEINEDDPPVHVNLTYSDSIAHRNWIQENASLTTFLFQMLVHEITITAPFGYWAEASEKVLNNVTRHYTPFDFPAWRWPIYPTRFYRGQGVLVVTVGDSEVQLAAQTEQGLALLAQTLEIQLE